MAITFLCSSRPHSNVDKNWKSCSPAVTLLAFTRSSGLALRGSLQSEDVHAHASSCCCISTSAAPNSPDDERNERMRSNGAASSSKSLSAMDIVKRRLGLQLEGDGMREEALLTPGNGVIPKELGRNKRRSQLCGGDISTGRLNKAGRISINKACPMSARAITELALSCTLKNGRRVLCCPRLIDINHVQFYGEDEAGTGAACLDH
eukprot:1158826-Pelagomonas_calceolata.AAC.9